MKKKLINNLSLTQWFNAKTEDLNYKHNKRNITLGKIVQFQKVSNHILSTEGIEISWGVGFCMTKNLKKWTKLRGVRVLKKITSMGEVWIFSGIKHVFTHSFKWSTANQVYFLIFQGFHKHGKSLLGISTYSQLTIQAWIKINVIYIVIKR